MRQLLTGHLKTPFTIVDNGYLSTISDNASCVKIRAVTWALLGTEERKWCPADLPDEVTRLRHLAEQLGNPISTCLTLDMINLILPLHDT